MKSKRGMWRLWAEYLAIRLVFLVLSVLPEKPAAAIGRAFGFLLWKIDRRHRERAVSQSMERLGLSRSEAEEFGRRNFRHYGLVLMEFCRLKALRTPDDFSRRVNYNGIVETAESILAEGKGIVFVTGHFGNWEWSGAAMAVRGFMDGAIARPLDNPLANEFVRSVRESSGGRIWDKSGAIRKALASLKAGRGFGVLIDQDAGPAGWPAPFLGKPASTIQIPVELAVRTGAPLLVGVLGRDGGEPLRFSMRFRPARRPVPGADPGEDARRLLAEINADLESLILEDPVQWLWIHRRWKTPFPAGEAGRRE